MSSPRSRTQTEFDATIGRELRNWGDRQRAPASARDLLLEKAARQKTGRFDRIQLSIQRLPRPIHNLHNLLFEKKTIRFPDLPYAELTRWLHAQAAWQHLGNDRRAARFVC